MSKIIGMFVAFQYQSFLLDGKLHVQSSAVIGGYMSLHIKSSHFHSTVNYKVAQ